jgi:AcrR family transcriptional regulator
MAAKRKQARTVRPKPRGPLTREQVLRMAVRIADEAGLEALSMRELGRRLGVEAMSLYHHVAGKEEVLDGIADLVLTEVDLPGTEIDWRTSMRARAMSAWKAFGRHPWAPSLVDARVRGGPGRLRYLETVLAVLRRAGFTLEHAVRAFSILDGYLYGSCQQSSIRATTGAGGADAAEAFLRALPVREYPNLAEMAALQAAGPGYDEERGFEFGLDLILDGLQRILDADRIH